MEEQELIKTPKPPAKKKPKSKKKRVDASESVPDQQKMTPREEKEQELKSKKDEANQRLRRVRDLKEKDAQIWIELAEELYEIKEHSLYLYMRNGKTGENYKSFSEFSKNEAEWSERQANYLVSIWHHYVVEHDREFLKDVKHIGWSKLKELIGVLDEDNKVEIVSQVDGSDGGGGLSVREVKSFVKEKKSKEEKDRKKGNNKSATDSATAKDVKQENPRKKSLALYPEQMENFEMALSTAKAITGTESDAEAVDLISLDFQSHHADSGEEAKVSLVRNLESALDRRVVLFGINTVEFLKGGDLSDAETSADDFFSLLERETGQSIISFKDGAVVYAGFNEDGGPPVLSSLLEYVESVSGVQLVAIQDNEVIYYHDDLEDFIGYSEEE